MARTHAQRVHTWHQVLVRIGEEPQAEVSNSPVQEVEVAPPAFPPAASAASSLLFGEDARPRDLGAAIEAAAPVSATTTVAVRVTFQTDISSLVGNRLQAGEK